MWQVYLTPVKSGYYATGIFANIYCQSGFDSQVKLSCWHFTCSHCMYKAGRRPCYISVSYCIAYRNSFRYGSLRCWVSTIQVLRRAIRQRFSCASATPFAWLLFFYILRQIQHMVQHNTVRSRPPKCVHKLFIVDHCIRLRNTMAIAKDRSRINQTQSITPVYIFSNDSTDQDLHRPSRFRVYVIQLDISSRTIYSLICCVKLYQSRSCNTGHAKAVKPWLRTCCRMCNIKQNFEEKNEEVCHWWETSQSRTFS